MQFGFRPGDPSTDRGAYALDVLNYWRQSGIAGHRIAAYAAVDQIRFEGAQFRRDIGVKAL